MGGVIQTVSTIVETAASEIFNILAAFPVCQLVKSGYHRVQGDKEKASIAWKNTKEGGINIIESTPGLGHVLATCYYLKGSQRAKIALKKATRTTLIMASGIAVVATMGGAAPIATAGIATGQICDVITGDSKIMEIGEAIRKERGIESITRSTVQLAATCLGDTAGARAGSRIFKQWKKRPINLKEKNDPMSENLKKATWDDRGERVNKPPGPKTETVYKNAEMNIFTKDTVKADAKNCQFAAKVGVGVNCKVEPLGNGRSAVIMEGGQKIGDAIRQGTITYESLLRQLEQLKLKLNRLEICHSDMKPDNLAVLPNGQLRLIDCGDVGPYGTVRTVTYCGSNHPNHSILVDGHISGEYGPGTDLRGFGNVERYIKDIGQSNPELMTKYSNLPIIRDLAIAGTCATIKNRNNFTQDEDL